jgi:hypothetical protein
MLLNFNNDKKWDGSRSSNETDSAHIDFPKVNKRGRRFNNTFKLDDIICVNFRRIKDVPDEGVLGANYIRTSFLGSWRKASKRT